MTSDVKCVNLLIELSRRWQFRFAHLHNHAEKFGLLTSSNLFDEDLNSTLEPHRRDRVRGRENETAKPRRFSSCSTEERSDVWRALELLHFVQNSKASPLAASVPNMVFMLRIILTVAMSVASCERSFSKLKLIKNHLRSIMTNSRLNGLLFSQSNAHPQNRWISPI